MISVTCDRDCQEYNMSYQQLSEWNLTEHSHNKRPKTATPVSIPDLMRTPGSYSPTRLCPDRDSGSELIPQTQVLNQKTTNPLAARQVCISPCKLLTSFKHQRRGGCKGTPKLPRTDPALVQPGDPHS